MKGLRTPINRRYILSRRTFLGVAAKTSAVAAIVGPHHLVCAAQDRARDGRKIKYVGWQIGVTYQTPGPRGLTRDYLMRLIDEMAAHRMNLLSLSMISNGYYDPNHDGYCWPIRNEKLKCYQDTNAINSDASTEFVREVITAAGERGIAVQLFMNGGIWNPKKICHGYPDATVQLSRKEAELKTPKSGIWTHCPDSPGGWQARLDEVADLLDFYGSPNVKSYSLERISYRAQGFCYCSATQELFHRDTGLSIFDSGDEQFEAWKVEKITGYLQQYAEYLRRLRPGIGFWLHTRCSPGWGHDPKRLGEAGIDCLLPHYMHFGENEQQVHRRLAYLAPNPCVLHFCVRDQAPQKYPILIKTPEIIREGINYALNYRGENLAGLLFFNETATSPNNKKAVYEQIKRFTW